MRWRASKARHVLKTLQSLGWNIKRQHGSHIMLEREDGSMYMFGFHMSEEIGPPMLTRIARKTGLRPEAL